MPHDNPFDPQGHELWPDFVKFLDGKGIPVEETKGPCKACGFDWGHSYCGVCAGTGEVTRGGREQWIKWWECFAAGAGAQFRLDQVGV